MIDSTYYVKAHRTACNPLKKVDARLHSSVKQPVNNHIRPKMYSQGSRTGAGLRLVMTDKHTPSSLQSSSRAIVVYRI